MPSLKQIGTICFFSIFSIFPTFADNEPTLIPTPASCNNSVLNTTEGSAALEAIYTANTINTTWYTGYGANGQAASPTTCNYDGTINLPATNPSRAGYEFAGWKLKTCTVPSSNLATNGTNGYGHVWSNNADYCYNIDSEGDWNTVNCSTVSDLSLNQWKVEFSYGTVRGIASCQPTAPADMVYIVNNYGALLENEMTPEEYLSGYIALAGQEKGAIAQQALQAYAQNGEQAAYAITFPQLLTMPSNTNFSTNSTGQYCFCQATHYTPNGGVQCPLTSPAWVFYVDDHSVARCVQHCSTYCAGYVRRYSGFRAALFGSN